MKLINDILLVCDTSMEEGGGGGFYDYVHIVCVCVCVSET